MNNKFTNTTELEKALYLNELSEEWENAPDENALVFARPLGEPAQTDSDSTKGAGSVRDVTAESVLK